MSDKIYAPNVYLFAFHLANNEYPSLLWKKCKEILESLKIDFDLEQNLNLHKETESHRVDLWENPGKKAEIWKTFEGTVTLNNNPVKIKGFAYPLRIHDSYALLLNICRPEFEDEEKTQKTEEVDISLLGQLNLNDCLLPELLCSSLGQTILITAGLSEEQKRQPENFKKIADECLEAFISDYQKRPKFYREGKLFGSPIFEYGTLSDSADYKHILIWLFSEEETDKKFGHYYQELIDLFFYRNKIIQGYRDSRKIEKIIQNEYENIDREIDEFENITKSDSLSKEDLDKLQAKIKTLVKKASEYARLIRDLQEKRHTLVVNGRNYGSKLKQIKLKLQAKSSYNYESDIEFLVTDFREKYRIYQEQIAADLGYFKPGSGLLDAAIATIRGIVEIEQARIAQKSEERDRKIEETIQAVGAGIGAGLGAGGIFASSFTLITPSNPIQLNFKSTFIHPFTLSLVLSLLFGLSVGWLTWSVTRLIQR